MDGSNGTLGAVDLGHTWSTAPLSNAAEYFNRELPLLGLVMDMMLFSSLATWAGSSKLALYSTSSSSGAISWYLQLTRGFQAFLSTLCIFILFLSLGSLKLRGMHTFSSSCWDSSSISSS